MFSPLKWDPSAAVHGNTAIAFSCNSTLSQLRIQSGKSLGVIAARRSGISIPGAAPTIQWAHAFCGECSKALGLSEARF
jgi:hypothetical protein